MTVTVTIGGVTMTGDSHFVAENSVIHTSQIGQRDTLRLAVVSADGSYRPAIGAPVVFTVDGTARFGGNIRQLDVQQFGDSLISTVGCASWEQLFDRRPTGARSYTAQTAGDIFSDLVTNTMGGDGITASVAVAGPTISVLSFDFASVREAFDTICSLASSDTETYMWDCTPDKVVRFYRSDSYHAPFDITETSTEVLQVGGSVRMANSQTLDKYANRVFYRLGKFIREATPESFAIGSATEFTVSFPIAKEPIVQVDGSAQSVGVLDSDTGKDWYWQEGSPVVTRGTGTGGTTLDITYQGYESKTVGPVSNDAEIDARAAVEGGTGYYTAILESDNPSTYQDAVSAMQAYLDKFSAIPSAVEYPTPTDGCKAGQWQDIDWPTIGASATYVFESCTMQQQGGLWSWKVRAISGALLGDYKKRLSELRGGSSGSSVVSGGGAVTGTSGVGAVALYAPGTLGIEAEATAAAYLSRSATPSAIKAYVKDAPVGANLSLTLYVGGSAWLSLTIAAGTTSVAATSGDIAGASAIPADTRVVVGITGVGSTFPGSDLATFLYF